MWPMDFEIYTNMEFERSIKDLRNAYGNLLDKDISPAMRTELCDKVFEFQLAKSRSISFDEVLLLEQQNQLLDEIKSSIRNNKGLVKEVEETFEFSNRLDSSVSFSRTASSACFLLEPDRNMNKTQLLSPKARINRRGFLPKIDTEAVLESVRSALGSGTSQVLRTILDSWDDTNTSKYKVLYQRQKTLHEATELGRREASTKLSKMLEKIQQLQDQLKKSQNDKKSAAKALSSIQTRQAKLTKLQTKLLIRQKLLSQQQKHLQTQKLASLKQKSLMESQRHILVAVDNLPSNLKISQLQQSLQKRIQSCRDKQRQLSEQFLAMEDIISKLSD